MTWKTTATLLLSVPELRAPPARCARAGLSVLLLERAEIPGSKNLSGGRLYTHALAELLPQYHLTAPLERRITHESLSLLTPDGATTFSSLQPGGESWSVLRARLDPWLVAEAEKEGVECIPGATVDTLYEENGRICGVICGDDILRARYVVLAEGANSILAERHGLVTRPAGEAMALGIKEVLALEASSIEERFHLENNEGAALLFSGGICDDLPGGAFLYTNQQTLSLGIVCPLSSLTQSRIPASELLARFKTHPAVRPLIKNTESLEYGAHLVPEGGLHSMPVQYGGNGCATLGAAINTSVGLRLYPDYATAVDKMVRVKDIFMPVENNAKRYDAMNKGIFKDLTKHTDVILKKSYEVMHVS